MKLVTIVFLLALAVFVTCRAASYGDRKGDRWDVIEELIARDMDDYEDHDGVQDYMSLESEEDSANVDAMSCDCDYHPGGCTISDKAPPGLACKCVYKGFWTCGGEVTHCKDDKSYYCKHPDRSYQSCKQGEGDCGGYR